MKNSSAEQQKIKQGIFDGLQELYPDGAPIEKGASVWTHADMVKKWVGETSPPTETQIADAAAITRTARTVKREVRTQRESLRQWWQSEAVPPHVRGPYQGKFEAAAKLLDDGDAESALALIEFAEPMPAYNEDQLSDFERVKTFLISALTGFA